MSESDKKLIIDEQLAHGLGQKLIEALAIYFKLPAEQIRVANDDSSPEHTLVYLSDVPRSKPKVKLRLQELKQHQRTEIHFKSDDPVTDIELRIEDGIIVEIAQKILGE